MRVRTRAFLPYPLPRGLSSGAEVEVLRAEHDSCLVRDLKGQEWLVDSFVLDPGQMVWVDGQWQPDCERKVG